MSSDHRVDQRGRHGAFLGGADVDVLLQEREVRDAHLVGLHIRLAPAGRRGVRRVASDSPLGDAGVSATLGQAIPALADPVRPRRRRRPAGPGVRSGSTCTRGSTRWISDRTLPPGSHWSRGLGLKFSPPAPDSAGGWPCAAAGLRILVCHSDHLAVAQLVPLARGVGEREPPHSSIGRPGGNKSCLRPLSRRAPCGMKHPRCLGGGIELDLIRDTRPKE